jgi:hypothetical protein
MNQASSVFGQILQIFSKGDFYSVVKETKSEKGAKDLPAGDNSLSCSSAS